MQIFSSLCWLSSLSQHISIQAWNNFENLDFTLYIDWVIRVFLFTLGLHYWTCCRLNREFRCCFLFNFRNSELNLNIKKFYLLWLPSFVKNIQFKSVKCIAFSWFVIKFSICSLSFAHFTRCDNFIAQMQITVRVTREWLQSEWPLVLNSQTRSHTKLNNLNCAHSVVLHSNCTQLKRQNIDAATIAISPQRGGAVKQPKTTQSCTMSRSLQFFAACTV